MLRIDAERAKRPDGSWRTGNARSNNGGAAYRPSERNARRNGACGWSAYSRYRHRLNFHYASIIFQWSYGDFMSRAVLRIERETLPAERVRNLDCFIFPVFTSTGVPDFEQSLPAAASRRVTMD